MIPRDEVWASVVAAVGDGGDAGDGLQLDHLRKATDRTFLEDGVVTFLIEGHRDILGRRTRDAESSAYQLEQVTCVWSPNDGLSVLSRVPGVPVLDIPRLADELVEVRIEYVADRCSILFTCTDEDAARDVADDVASSVDWIADHRDALEEAGVPQPSADALETSCVEVATHRLLQLWERRVD